MASPTTPPGTRQEAIGVLRLVDLLVSAVRARHVAPTRALTEIESYRARLQGATAPEPALQESLPQMLRLCDAAREKVEAYRQTLN